jgi:large subunit ribosomal protein L4
MDTLTLPIINAKGAEVAKVSLDKELFGQKISAGALYQTVTTYLANQRKGLAATKTRGEVSGGGKKPWKQKGTGRARVGSTRSPLWRHGGVVFGPHPRDFSVTLPKGVRLSALAAAVSVKVAEGNVIVADALSFESEKTKDAVALLTGLNIDLKKNKSYKVLVLLDKEDVKARRALGNVALVTVGLAQDANAYELLKHKKIVVTKPGLEQIIKRLQK